MPLSDWIQYTSGTPSIGINTATPISDAGSLRIQVSSNQKASLISDGAVGFTKGRLRSLFRIDTVSASSPPYRCGISLFHSALNITSTGSAYLYGVEFEPALSTNHVFFDICTTGLDSGRTRYFQGVDFSRTNGVTIIALEVEWAYEPTLLGGTRFIFREGHGTLTNFSNLVEVGRVQIFSGTGPINPALLTSSAAEGLFLTGGTSSTLIDVNIDKTTVVELT